MTECFACCEEGATEWYTLEFDNKVISNKPICRMCVADFSDTDWIAVTAEPTAADD
jgi:hypothetical protein